MKFGEEDEDIEMFLDTSYGITFRENDVKTYFFSDKDNTYSYGVYEVFEVDGEKFFADFWFSFSEDFSDDEINDKFMNLTKRMM